MPKAGDIKYCDLLGGRKTNAAFVYVPPSAFWMGDVTEKENPVHLVGVSRGFWLQQTELTEEQYQYLTDKNTPADPRPKKPKPHIRWNEVISFISNKPFRLPTEAEWELSARAGVAHKYQWAGSNIHPNVAWLNHKVQLRNVADLKANSIGVYDMSGNVREWSSDGLSSITSAPQLDPRGTASGFHRIWRGGGLYYHSRSARVAHRDSLSLDDSDRDLGVRFVWEI